MRRFRSGTLRSGSVDRPVMGASSAGSYEVTPPGRSRATTSSAGPTDRPKDSTTRQAYGESDPAEDVSQYPHWRTGCSNATSPPRPRSRLAQPTQQRSPHQKAHRRNTPDAAAACPHTGIHESLWGLGSVGVRGYVDGSASGLTARNSGLIVKARDHQRWIPISQHSACQAQHQVISASAGARQRHTFDGWVWLLSSPTSEAAGSARRLQIFQDFEHVTVIVGGFFEGRDAARCGECGLRESWATVQPGSDGDFGASLAIRASTLVPEASGYRLRCVRESGAGVERRWSGRRRIRRQ
jgi:hypothetical protein